MLNLKQDFAQLGSQLTAERVRALKRIIPKAEVQAVLKATGQHRRRCPRLPPWFLVWFAIALGLFCRDCYRQVFQWLQPFRRGGTPRRSTLCEARHRLGVAPLRLLAQRVVRCLATPQTPGAFYRGLRLMALDSFVLNIPDTPANARVFGRPGSSRAPGAFPQVRVLALCETGTHILYRTLLKPCHRGEVSMAAYLLRFLLEDMLLLWDRNFLSYALVRQVRQRRAHLLARVKNNLIFSPCVAWAMVRTWPSCIPRPSTAATTRAASWCGSSSTPSTTQGGRARGRSIAC